MKLLNRGYSIFQSLIFCALAAVLTVAVVDGASAQEWRPKDPVEISLPDSPGGSNDLVSRIVQGILQDRKLVETPVTVANKPGGNGNISLSYLEQKKGDAHFIRTSSITLNLSQIVGLSTYRYTDFTPLAQMVGDYVAFAVRSDSNIKTAKDLIERLKKDPSTLSVGVTAIGGSNHIPLVFVCNSIGADARKVRTPVFKSSGEALTALLGGHVELLISSVATVPPHVESGRIRVLAVSSEKRAGGVLANVPTWKELNVDCDFSAWRGFIGPKGMTAAQIAFWDATLAKVVATDTWKAAVKKNLWDDDYMNSKVFRAYLDRIDPQLRAALAELGLVK